MLDGQADIDFVWRSFEIGPERPHTPDRTVFEVLTQDYGVEPSTLVSRFNDIQRISAELGLALDMNLIRPVNTRAVHRLAHYARVAGIDDAFRERAFHAYHVERLNVADTAVLIGLGASAGLREADVARVLRSDEYDAEVLADRSRAATLGITSVPTLRHENGNTLSLNSPLLMEVLHFGEGTTQSERNAIASNSQ